MTGFLYKIRTVILLLYQQISRTADRFERKIREIKKTLFAMTLYYVQLAAVILFADTGAKVCLNILVLDAERNEE